MIFEEQPKTRQELYDRIRQTSKDEVVLDQMVRLGFWPSTGNPDQDVADDIRRKGELERELRELTEKHALLRNKAALAAELKQQRLRASKEKQRATKERRALERATRAQAWQQRKGLEVLYLGKGVSGGLQERGGDLEKLRKRGLPELRDPPALATAIGIPLGQLRFLAYDRKVAGLVHYRTWKVPKKTGGERTITAPLPRLKHVQRWILTNVLEKLETHAAAHGFRRTRSIVSNAKPHVATGVVVNLDLQDFFPSVSYPRVKGLFRWMGYSESVATVLALLCTARDTEEVELDGRTWHVGTAPRRLPQGAPTSPAITNLICDRLDRRLSSASGKLGFVYTRYADDLTFSIKEGKDAPVGKLLRQVEWLVEKDGFRVHPDKTRVLRKGSRQEVTGIVVNERPAIARDVLRRFRATLFQIDKDGPAGKHWGRSKDVLASIHGFARYVHMVDPAKGSVLLERVKAIHAKWNYVRPRRAPKPASRNPFAPRAPRAMPTLPAAAGRNQETEARAPELPPKATPTEEPKKKPWWKFW